MTRVRAEQHFGAGFFATAVIYCSFVQSRVKFGWCQTFSVNLRKNMIFPPIG